MSSSNETSAVQKMIRGSPLKKDRQREENKIKLAVCRIRKRLLGGQGDRTVGSGSIVRDLFPEWRNNVLIITSDKVVSKDHFNIKEYFLDVLELCSKGMKRYEFESLTNSEDVRFTSGLALIPLDTKKLQRSGLLKHRPLDVCEQGGNNSLYCQVVVEDTQSFAVCPFDLKGDFEGQYVLSDSHFSFKDLLEVCGQGSSNRKPHGAVISMADGERDIPVAVGVLTFVDNQITPVWLSNVSESRQLQQASLSSRTSKLYYY